MRQDASGRGIDSSSISLRSSPEEVNANQLQANIQNQSTEQHSCTEADKEQQGAPFWYSTAKKNPQKDTWKQSVQIGMKNN